MKFQWNLEWLKQNGVCRWAGASEETETPGAKRKTESKSKVYDIAGDGTMEVPEGRTADIRLLEKLGDAIVGKVGD